MRDSLGDIAGCERYRSYITTNSTVVGTGAAAVAGEILFGISNNTIPRSSPEITSVPSLLDTRFTTPKGFSEDYPVPLFAASLSVFLAFDSVSNHFTHDI